MNALCTKIAVVVLAMVGILSALSADAAQYTYDQLGRLVYVVEADGSTAQYTYDANGNITSIARTSAAPAVSIASFSPAAGPVGTSVTIRGVGFSTTLAQNTVRFNGTLATVTAANASMIIAVVPPGATSGLIAVTSPSGSASSTSPYTVTTVTISGFTPTRGVAGTAVTINGAGFSTTLANNVVKFNNTTAVVTGATATQLQVTVPVNAISGRIKVTNGGVSGLSTSDFFVSNGSHAASDIQMTGRLVPSGVGLVYTLEGASKLGEAVFDGVQGQHITLIFDNRNLNGTYYLYAPDGSLVTSNYLHINGVIDLPVLPATGTYSLVLEAANSSTVGSITVKLVADSTGTVPSDGTPKAVSLVTGQNTDYTFTATAGQTFNLYLTQFVTNPINNGLNAVILKQDGTLVANCNDYYAWFGACRFTTPAAGTYRLRIDPYGSITTSFNIRLNADFTAALTVGTSQAVNLSKAGQQARLTFSTATAQSLTLGIDSLSVPPPQNGTVYFDVFNSSNVQIATFGTVGPAYAMELPNLAAGNYSIVIRPYENMATATMNLKLVTNPPGVLQSNGTPLNYASSVAGQRATFTFAGTTGQNLSLAFTGAAFNPSAAAYYATVYVYRPDGQEIKFFYAYSTSIPGDVVNLNNLPQTGTYSVVVTPGGMATMSFAVVLSTNVTGTLTAGTPLSVNLNQPGRAATLKFTLATAKTVALYVGSVVTTPANKGINIYIWNPAGTSIYAGGTGAASSTLNLPNLPAGTYTVEIAPSYAATATMQVTLANGVTGILPLGSSATFSTTVPGQFAYFTFNGTTGQRLDLGVTGLALTPVDASYVMITANPPSGAWWKFFYDYLSSTPGEPQVLGVLPETGTYSVLVQPNGQATATYTLTLSQAASAALTIGAPYSLNLNLPARSAALTFSATAGQSLTLNLASIATVPAGKTVFVEVRNAGGSLVANAGSTAATQSISLPSLSAGTYTVLITVANASTATMQVTVQ